MVCGLEFCGSEGPSTTVGLLDADFFYDVGQDPLNNARQMAGRGIVLVRLFIVESRLCFVCILMIMWI